MIETANLVSFLDNILRINLVRADHSNNGLQIQGSRTVKKAIFAVDFSLELVEKAKEFSADFIFVHHGISWGNNLKYITGNIYERVSALVKRNISLYGAHLPLDMNDEHGHNFLISNMIGLKKKEAFFEYDGVNIGFLGQLSSKSNVSNVNEVIKTNLLSLIKIHSPTTLKLHSFSNSILIDNSNGKEIKKVAVVSGGAGLECVCEAISKKVECLITGEFTHSSCHIAKEGSLSIVAPGHYISEIPGCIAIMLEVKKAFPDIDVKFIDIPTNL